LPKSESASARAEKAERGQDGAAAVALARDDDELVGQLVGQISRLYGVLLSQELASLGTSIGHLPVLLALINEPGLTQTDLARMAHIEQPTMAVTLQRMERDGLIERRPDKNDGRQSRVHLTAGVRRRANKILGLRAAAEEKALSDLSPRDRTQLVRLLGRVRTTLAAQAE
jgi:MarR family transcriptional regulator, transcriptional regulator for hemolysin